MIGSADCNNNGIGDACDITDGTSADCDANGVPDECETDAAPELVGIQRGLGISPDTFISPLTEAVPLTAFTLDASEPLVLDDQEVVYTGPGPSPVASVTGNGCGEHTVRLEPAPEPGHWLRLTLHVTGAFSGLPAEFDVWIAHHPNDVNQDGVVNVQDATAFGEVFRGRKAPELVDLNGDGTVNVQDATTFGDMWHGADAATRASRGNELSAKP